MKRFKNIALTIVFLCYSIFCFGQSKWTCFPNNDSLHFASEKGTLKTLGMFNYTDNSTWMINTDGIYIYNGSSWSIIDYKKQLLHKNIYTYLVDSKHNVWIGFGLPPGADKKQSFNLGGISQYNGKKWINIKNEDLNIPPPNVNRIFEVSNGDIWFSAAGFTSSGFINPFSFIMPIVPVYQKVLEVKKSLIQYSQGKWNIYQKNLLCKENSVLLDIFETRDKRIWFPTSSGSLYYFENSNFIMAGEEIGYNYNIVKPFSANYYGRASTFFDSKKNLWLLNDSELIPIIGRYDGQNWQTFDKKSGIIGSLRANYLCEMRDGSFVLFANRRTVFNIDIYKFDGVDKWNEVFKYTLKRKHTDSLYNFATSNDQEGKIWTINSGDLAVYDGSQYKFEMQHEDLRILFIDRQNRVWTANKKELYLKENSTWNDIDSVHNVTGVLEDKSGVVWILTENNGLVSYSNGKWETFTEKNGLLSSKIIRVYCTHDNSIWVITDKGMCKFNRN